LKYISIPSSFLKTSPESECVLF